MVGKVMLSYEVVWLYKVVNIICVHNLFSPLFDVISKQYLTYSTIYLSFKSKTEELFSNTDITPRMASDVVVYVKYK